MKTTVEYQVYEITETERGRFAACRLRDPDGGTLPAHKWADVRATFSVPVEQPLSFGDKLSVDIHWPA